MSSSKNLIVVTGCSGRIGTKVTKRFSDQGFDVVGFDIRPPQGDCGKVDYVKVDLTSDQSVAEGFLHIKQKYGSRITAIIHLAAYYSFSGGNPELYEKITVQGTGRMLHEAKKFQTEQFLFSSTMLVYKPCKPGQKITESSPLLPKWDYPKSKVRTENLMHNERGHIPIMIMRIAGCYDDECHSIPISTEMQRLYEHQFTSRVYPGDITHGASYLHLDDLTDAIWLSVQKRAEVPSETILLIGEDKTMSYDSIQREISRLLDGRELHTYEVPKWFAKFGAWFECQFPSIFESNFIKPWMIDLADDHYELDISRARSLLGWQPKHFIGDVLPKMVDFLKTNPIEFYNTNDLVIPGWLKKKYSKETINA